MSSANAFKLDWSQILSFGKELYNVEFVVFEYVYFCFSSVSFGLDTFELFFVKMKQKV